MIRLMTKTACVEFAEQAFVVNWDEPAAAALALPANHNLTKAARSSNVVPIGGHRDEPDFRPDLGARMAVAA